MSSESLKCIGPPNGDEYLIRTTWQSEEDWKKWLNNDERGAIQQQIDSITGEKFGSGDNKFNLWQNRGEKLWSVCFTFSLPF